MPVQQHQTNSNGGATMESPEASAKVQTPADAGSKAKMQKVLEGLFGDDSTVGVAGQTSGIKLGRRVAFQMTAAMSAEVERIKLVADLISVPDVFRRAFTLLRIHVDAAQQGHQIFQVDPRSPQERFFITLPFAVEQSN